MGKFVWTEHLHSDRTSEKRENNYTEHAHLSIRSWLRDQRKIQIKPIVN